MSTSLTSAESLQALETAMAEISQGEWPMVLDSLERHFKRTGELARLRAVREFRKKHPFSTTSP